MSKEVWEPHVQIEVKPPRPPATSLTGLFDEITRSVGHWKLGGYEFGVTKHAGVFSAGRSRGIDILLISRYPLKDQVKDDLVQHAGRQRPQMACWPLFCIDRIPIKGVEHDYTVARTDKLMASDGDPLPWGDWLADAMRLMKPKAFVILTWHGNNGAVTNVWPMRPKLTDSCVFKVEEPKNDIVRFRREWEDVEGHLRSTMHLGCKRMATGRVDALSILMQRNTKKARPGARTGAQILLDEARDMEEDRVKQGLYDSQQSASSADFWKEG